MPNAAASTVVFHGLYLPVSVDASADRSWATQWLHDFSSSAITASLLVTLFSMSGSVVFGSPKFAGGLPAMELGAQKYHSPTTCINTSETDRTPAPGRQPYLSAGMALASATIFTCSVSMSAMNSERTCAADFASKASCASAERVGTIAAAASATANRYVRRHALRDMFFLSFWETGREI